MERLEAITEKLLTKMEESIDKTEVLDIKTCQAFTQALKDLRSLGQTESGGVVVRLVGEVGDYSG